MTREDILKLLNKHQDNDTLDVKTAKEMVNIIFNDHEAQLKQRDEEIVKLKIEVLNSFPKIAAIKARSIVAMLFWEWKKSIRESNDCKFYDDEFNDGGYWYIKAKEEMFKQAYKILKDNA